jgi:hypothetical protein
VARRWHAPCVIVGILEGRARMVPFILWLLGVPVGLIILLLLFGVIHF